MSGLLKRELFPFARPFSLVDDEWAPEDMIRVDEYHEDGVLVIKAELPGIDPDKDVELTVSDRVLHIAAHRHEEETKEAQGYTRKEIRSGSFQRTLPLPAGVAETEVEASYEDGILEIRIPEPPAPEAKKIPITKR